MSSSFTPGPAPSPALVPDLNDPNDMKTTFKDVMMGEMARLEAKITEHDTKITGLKKENAETKNKIGHMQDEVVALKSVVSSDKKFADLLLARELVEHVMYDVLSGYTLTMADCTLPNGRWDVHKLISVGWWARIPNPLRAKIEKEIEDKTGLTISMMRTLNGTDRANEPTS